MQQTRKPFPVVRRKNEQIGWMTAAVEQHRSHRILALEDNLLHVYTGLCHVFPIGARWQNTPSCKSCADTREISPMIVGRVFGDMRFHVRDLKRGLRREREF